MNICILGTGYVGLVAGACFADKGNNVWCVDTDGSKIAAIESGHMPIYEPGLSGLVFKNCSQGRLRFTTSIKEGIKSARICFITVGTPPRPDGRADMSCVIEAAEAIGAYMDHEMIIVNKSTVPIGASEAVAGAIKRQLSLRQKKTGFEIVSNPEFLREGSAVEDFMHPDRVVLGVDSARAAELMAALYRPFVTSPESVIVMDNKSAEITKYAANAMLATRISFINEIA